MRGEILVFRGRIKVQLMSYFTEEGKYDHDGKVIPGLIDEYEELGGGRREALRSELLIGVLKWRLVKFDVSQ